LDLKETGWEGVHWMHMAQARDKFLAVVKTVMNPPAPKKKGYFLNI
jgi:hypothetical protein